MVGRKHAHHRIGIERIQDVRCESDAGSGVALRRFRQNLLLGNFRKLTNDLAAQVIVRQNPNPFGGYNCAQPINRLLNQRPFAEKAQDLLRSRFTAARPEPRTTASGEDQAVIVLFGHILQFIARRSKNCYSSR